jgi:phosphate transport system substrate-binding protein
MVRFGAALLLFAACGLSLLAQPGQHPTESVRRLYVNAFQGGSSSQLREKLVAHLRADSRWQVVDNPSQADAIVDGSGEIWVKGYVSTSIHPSPSSRAPVYGGYLSVEVKRSGETLWSYLVTPGKLHWNGVDNDMVDHVIHLMDAALSGNSIWKGAPSTNPSPHLAITGAGSTFAAPLYQQWLESFEESRPDIRASYQPIGSENGIQSLTESKVDFAASDVPASDVSVPRVRQYATVLGGVVVAYNLAGIGPDLRFTPEVLAGIYLGKITRWNDEKLREINRGIKLPDKSILVVHRSDGSGTSFAFSQFLTRTNPDWAKSVGAGMKVQWPAGEGVEGNEAVAAHVAQAPGAIGYMELTYAIRHQLSFGLIRNAAGNFVQANLVSLAAATKSLASEHPRSDSVVNALGTDAYPIATFTWLLIPENQDPQKALVIRDLLRWMLTSGQKECAGLGHLPLPRQLADSELHQVDH